METSLLRAFLFVAAAASVAVAVEPAAAPPVDAWVLVGPRDSNQMSGSLHDLARARSAAGEGPALWARRDGHEWLIRDARWLARARELMAPVNELEGKLSALFDEARAAGVASEVE